MNEIYRQLGNHNLWGKCTSRDAETVKATQIRSGIFTGTKTTVHEDIRVEHLAGWLKGSDAKGTGGEHQRCIVRIVWGDHNMNPSELQQSIPLGALDLIIESFGLRLAYGYFTSCFAGAAVLPAVRTTATTEIRSYAFSYHPKLALLWTHDAGANMIQAVCFAEAAQIDAFKRLLNAKWQLEGHGMMPAFLCSLMMSHEVDKTQIKIKEEVRRVEARTEAHGFTHRDERPAIGDLGDLLKTTSGFSTKVSATTRKLRVMESLNDFILEHLLSDSDTPSSLGGESSAGSPGTAGSDVTEVLRHNVALVQRRLKMQTVDNDYIRDRIEVQVNALFNLIGQKNSFTSEALARDSKLIAESSQRDSSSMKILAIVTMFFLPGTFVASIFAMPLLSWNDPETIKPRFGIYLAVALPLTVTTLIIYVIWSLFISAEKRRQIQKADDEFKKNTYSPRAG